jgi:hypothetical protein
MLCLAPARCSAFWRSTEAQSSPPDGHPPRNDATSIISFTVLDSECVALALDAAQFRYQIPLALSRHCARNVIAEHASTLVQRPRSLNTFSST